MKKLLVLGGILAMFMGIPNFAMAKCGSSHISFQGNQDPDDDEFLYTTGNAFNYANTMYKKEEYDFPLLGGRVYECDAEQACKSDTYVFAGTNYILEKRNVGNKILRCSTSPDYWKAYTYTECADSVSTNYRWKPIRFANDVPHSSHVCYTMDSGNQFCCYTGEHLKCILAKKTDSRVNWNGYGCNCGDTAKWDRKSGKCIATTTTPPPVQQSPAPVSTPTPTPVQTTTYSCVEQRGCAKLSGAAATECMSCCIVPKKTAIWDASTNKCVCQTNGAPDTSKTFDVTTRTCVGAGTPPTIVTFECDATKLATVKQWATKCQNNASIMAHINSIVTICDKKALAPDMFNTMYDELIRAITAENNCQQVATPVKPPVDNAAAAAAEQSIVVAYKQITSMAGDFDRSVWRNANGEFNTSRLVSDTVAGVVLGTAGGIITSNIIKKNQLNNGYEDLQCTIGGQVVAGYDDQFTVGVQ